MFANAYTYNQWKGLSPVLALDCCLYRHDIPVELRVIVHKYSFLSLDNDCLDEALLSVGNSKKKDKWLRFGHYSDWSLYAPILQVESLLLDQTLKILTKLATSSILTLSIKQA
jgi:hypothetical protein